MKYKISVNTALQLPRPDERAGTNHVGWDRGGSNPVQTKNTTLVQSSIGHCAEKLDS